MSSNICFLYFLESDHAFIANLKHEIFFLELLSAFIKYFIKKNNTPIIHKCYFWTSEWMTFNRDTLLILYWNALYGNFYHPIKWPLDKISCVVTGSAVYCTPTYLLNSFLCLISYSNTIIQWTLERKVHVSWCCLNLEICDTLSEFLTPQSTLI